MLSEGEKREKEEKTGRKRREEREREGISSYSFCGSCRKRW
jgi:hypothetical protein